MSSLYRTPPGHQPQQWNMEEQATELIRQPPSEFVEGYYKGLAACGLGTGLSVLQTPTMGKGVFAQRPFKIGEVVLQEPKLVGAQHAANKADALVCSHCMRYVGSLELQIGRRLIDSLQAQGEEPPCPAVSSGSIPAESEPGSDGRRGEVRGRKEGWSILEGETEGEEGGEGEGERDESGEGEGKGSGGVGMARRRGVKRGNMAGVEEAKEGNGATERAKAMEGEEEVEGQRVEAVDGETAMDKEEGGMEGKGENGEAREEEDEEEEEGEEERAGKEEEEEEAMDSCCKRTRVRGPKVPRELVAGLLDGTVRLPQRENFPLPEIVPCPGGCVEDVFCSGTCAEAAWEGYHSLLCCGPRSAANDVEALQRFKRHADETNDIFHVAAQVIAVTLLRAGRIRGGRTEGLGPVSGTARREEGESGGMERIAEEDMQVLRVAWEPFAVGHKDVWWDTMDLPDDVDPDEEATFRQQIKELAAKSLSLLKEAIFDECYAPLFSMEVYSRVIGMFELNNLAVVVPSPVENYFLLIDDLPPADKAEAEKLTRPLLEAFGDGYADHCEGTAFYALQSCVNHSCAPNTRAFKRDEDYDGRAVLLALRPIAATEEIFISYIDENQGLEERRADLADYGFVCRCAKCVQEESLN